METIAAVCFPIHPDLYLHIYGDDVLRNGRDNLVEVGTRAYYGGELSTWYSLGLPRPLYGSCWTAVRSDDATCETVLFPDAAMEASPRYAYSFLAAMRMIPMLLDEFQTLRHALLIRGTGRHVSRWNLYAHIKMYAIPLLAQSIRRAQRTAIAMEAKGLSDQKRTYYYVIGYSQADIWLGIYFTGVFAAAIWTGSLFPYFDALDVR